MVKNNFSVPFFILRNTPIPPCEAIEICFMSLTFLIAFVPLNKLIIIPIIVIIPKEFYLLLCHKPIRNKLQRKALFHHCFITHFSGLIAVRDICQKVWFYEHCSIIHLLLPEVVWDKKRC